MEVSLVFADIFSVAKSLTELVPVVTIALVLLFGLSKFFLASVNNEEGRIKASFDSKSENLGLARAAAEKTRNAWSDEASDSEPGTPDEAAHAVDRLTQRVDRLLEERQHLIAAVDERNEALLKDYHAQGLAQSRVAFRFSLAFASIGFILIVAAVGNAAFGDSKDTSTSTLTLISGTVVEAVSALFFVQANRARTVMTTFFDKLRVDRSISEALKLADGITDATIRSRLQTVLSLRLANADATDGILTTVMAADAPHAQLQTTVAEPSPSPSKAGSADDLARRRAGEEQSPTPRGSPGPP